MKLITTLAAAACLVSASASASSGVGGGGGFGGFVSQEAARPSSQAGPSQSSGLPRLEPTPMQVRHLWKLGKVWGFLKYHHPMIAKGDIDWDQELFKALPSVLDARSDGEGLAAIGAWAESFPAPEPARPQPVPEAAVHLLPDLDWIHDRDTIGDPLCSYLEAVHAGRDGSEEQRYVQKGPGAGNPLFRGEEPYADLHEVDAGYRLLALYRFWNIIQWWSPYRDQLDDDWDEVLGDFIPRFLAAESRDDYGLELLALCALVKDTHTGVSGLQNGAPPHGPAELPVVLRFVEGKAVVFRKLGTASDGMGLERGDVLLAIDGKKVSEMVEELAPFYPASNQPARLKSMARSLTRGPLGDVSVRIERAGEVVEFTAKREPRDPRAAYRLGRRDRPGPAFQLLDEDVAYVKLSTAKVDELSDYLAEAKGTKGLIIDIRNYPDEFMILYMLGGHLVKEKTPFATFTEPDWRTPGRSAWGNVVELSPREPHYGGQVVILVDESSISRAEFTTMAFQSVPGALVVGSTTAGADGNVAPIPFPGGAQSLLSGIGVFYPDRTPTQRVGVKIDVPCVPTAEGFREGRDEVLEEGVRQVLGKDATEERVRRICQ